MRAAYPPSPLVVRAFSRRREAVPSPVAEVHLVQHVLLLSTEYGALVTDCPLRAGTSGKGM